MSKKKIEKVKKEVKEGFRLNAPNALTLLRLVLTFLLVYLIFSDFSRIFIAIIFAFASLSDALDGWVARKFNQTSVMGARLDQVIDRIFTITIVIALVIYFSIGGIADGNFVLMLFLASAREIVGFPGLFVRFLRNKDFYEVRYVGKITCWFQGAAFTSIIAGFNFSIYLAALACLIGIYSGFDYLKRSFM